jgi:acyl-coenzyme A synthetase/AMP-(fatty) acid ligase
MGDLGYLDEQGRVWFCGRKSHRVVTDHGTLFSVTCESVFNTHADVYRSALVGVDRGRGTEPAICIELEPDAADRDKESITRELLELGQRFEHTRRIADVLYHPDFPVDIRHNTKIGREKLAVWATEQLT